MSKQVEHTTDMVTATASVKSKTTTAKMDINKANNQIENLVKE